MKKLLFIILFFSQIANAQFVINPYKFTSDVPPPTTTPFYVFIGQSNTGWNNLAALSAGEAAEYGIVHNAKMYNIRGVLLSTWVTMQTGTNTAANDYSYADGFGLESRFIQLLNQDDNREAYVFKKGHGGTSLAARAGNADWSPTGTYGSLTIGDAHGLYTQLNDAVAQATAGGKTLEFKGVVWAQGEDDAQTEAYANAYAANQIAFFTNFYSKLTTIFSNNSQTQEIIANTIIVQINHPLASYRSAVRTAKVDYAADVNNNAILLNVDDLVLQDDFVHYTAIANLNLGARLYWALNPTATPGSYDSDASAIFTAQTITTDNEKKHVNQFILDYKAAGLFTSTIGMYMSVAGDGTAASHAKNLRSPGTHDLTWNGTVTHTVSKMQGDGSSGYATALNPNSSMTNNNTAFSFYTRSAGTFTGFDLGANEGDNEYVFIRAGLNNGTSYYYTGDANGGGINRTDMTAFNGLHTVSRTAASSGTAFLNGALLATNTFTITQATPNLNLALMAYNNSGSVILFSNREYAMFEISEGRTQTQERAKWKAIQRLLANLNIF